MRDQPTRARVLFLDMRDSIRWVSDMFDRPLIVLACGERLTSLYKHRLEDQAPHWGVELSPHPVRVSTVGEARAILEGLSASLDTVNEMPPGMWDGDPHLPDHAFTTAYAYLTALPNMSVIEGGAQ